MDTPPADECAAHPLVCPAALLALRGQLGQPAADAFVQRFVQIWPQRRERLHQAVESHDRVQGQDAALSLSTGASMAGAHQLAAAALRLHGLFRGVNAPTWNRCGALVGEIDRLGAGSVDELLLVARRVLDAGPGPDGTTVPGVPSA